MKTILGYLGLVPFIVLAALTVWSPLTQQSDWVFIFSVYSAGIAIFMAGTLWGRVVDSDSTPVLLMSNIITLVIIGLLIVATGNQPLMLAGLTACHIANLACEPNKGNRPYFRLHLILTSVVVLSHLAILGVLYHGESVSLL
uniref:DUF3429 domain-containing protein n=1 Tax=Thaumasiovibrio occultus TaxID=1891184 RepID=UPI00131B22F5|nr:DUF3429 domain-containing protein [Thaumasiovibrio occultus]